MKYLAVITFLLACVFSSSAQQKEASFIQDGQIIYSDMDSWYSRKVKESVLIGGNEVVYYEPGPGDYSNIDKQLPALTPWSSSNVYAEIGVSAANQSVFRERRGDGYCARLETRLKKVVVLGVVNVKAIASGSIFLGQMEDPVTQADNARLNTFMGIEFTRAPSALVFDYKSLIGKKRLKATGGFKVRDVDGPDMAEAYALLQNRTEDATGNLIVKRVGTAWQRFDQSQSSWVNAYQMPIIYGDATKSPNYQSYMNLISESDPYYALNSKGEVKKYAESGWTDNKEEVTHMIIVFSASYQGGSFLGSPESKLWIDNIRLKYD
ncbi:PCMD domain-containing protein [Carboxylicivirga linearis]|uniref:PCMD domain-containing protein n=1 Tax=Carboxylicivirga linearis TaxID=1628157 RepID=A0ABS5K0U5_9BACT|nr:PCMD domain-containing protein [Carboxylicivirga linearis]MBS2100800.1 PCMD domain-containing protein [Carboxylicivirga linearis]